MTRLIQYANNAVSNLVAGISDTDTSLTLTPGGGSKFPALSGDRFFKATLIKSTGEMEVIKVTNRVTDTFTFERAAEPVAGESTALSFSAGDRVELRITAGGLGDELDRLDAAAFTSALNKSANYTVVEADISSLIRVATTSGNITINLPQISTLEEDFDIVVAKVTGDSNKVVIAAGGSNTINGSGTYEILGQWQGAWLIADRTNNVWTVIASGSGGVAVRTDTFVGDGTADPLTLSGDPGTKNNTNVFIGGVYQQKSSYTLTGDQLTPGGAIPVGVEVEVNWSQPIAVFTPSNGTITDDSVAENAGIQSSKLAHTPISEGLEETTVEKELQRQELSIIASDGPSRFRNVKQTIDAYLPASQCPETILLEKLRGDFEEFCVYTPLNTNGVDWQRWFFSNRFPSGNPLRGATHLGHSTIAKLYASEAIAFSAENLTTGTQAQAATSTEATADGTFVGTWTAAGTNNGVTDIRYSTAIGDTAEFTVVGAQRIVLRTTTNATVGGVMAVVIEDSLGNPIASDKYTLELIGGERRIDLRAVTAANFPMFITLADNLPTDTYTVTLTVSAANPVGGRAYVGGMQGFDVTAFNAVGRQATWNSTAFLTLTLPTAYYPGAQAIYQVTDTTRISWKYGVNVRGGVVGFTIYDSLGVEIDSANYKITDKKVDTYNANQIERQTLIAEDLPLGTYYIHMEVLPERNPSSTGPRIYDNGFVVYNQSQAGEVGVDDFDDLGIPKLIQATDLIPDVYLIQAGNLEQAIQVKKTTESDSAFEFVGGVHGFESTMTNVMFTADGSVIDFAGAANNTKFTAKEFKITFNTQLGFSTDATNYWAINDFEYRFSNAGYWAKVTREVTQPVDVQADYSLMFQVGNQDASQVGSVKSLDGGFLNWAIDGGGNKTYTTYDNSSNNEPYPCIGAAVWSENYAIYGVNISYKFSRLPYELLEEGLTTPLSFVQDRTDGTTKYYNRAFKYPASGGRRLIIGDTYTHVNNYRAVKGSGFESMFSGF